MGLALHLRTQPYFLFELFEQDAQVLGKLDVVGPLAHAQRLLIIIVSFLKEASIVSNFFAELLSPF